MPHDRGGELREPEHPDFAFASGAQRIGSGDASAGKLQQMAPLDAEKPRRLVCRDERLLRHWCGCDCHVERTWVSSHFVKTGSFHPCTSFLATRRQSDMESPLRAKASARASLERVPSFL